VTTILTIKVEINDNEQLVSMIDWRPQGLLTEAVGVVIGMAIQNVHWVFRETCKELHPDNRASLMAGIMESMSKDRMDSKEFQSIDGSPLPTSVMEAMLREYEGRK